MALTEGSRRVRATVLNRLHTDEMLDKMAHHRSPLGGQKVQHLELVSVVIARLPP